MEENRTWAVRGALKGEEAVPQAVSKLLQGREDTDVQETPFLLLALPQALHEVEEGTVQNLRLPVTSH